MAVELGEVSPERSILIGRVVGTEQIPAPTARNSQRVTRAGGASAHRVDSGLEDALDDLEAEGELDRSLGASDPELVLVLEAVEHRADLADVARRVGLEILVEAESAFEPDGEYSLASARARDRVVRTSIHALCVDGAALTQLRTAWDLWKRTGQVPGNAGLRDLFGRLRDLRPWNEQDRVAIENWEEILDGLLEDVPHGIEIELWYRQSSVKRSRAQREVETLVAEAGGTVLAASQIAAIGYHAIKAEVPIGALRDLAAGHWDAVRLVKSANVMFLRVRGQSLPDNSEPVSGKSIEPMRQPSGPPVAVLMDGVPAANHPLLVGRVELYDPDDLASEVDVADRRHGTAMASVAVWGDLNESRDRPLGRPLLVRPILTSTADTLELSEELPPDVLAPDLMWRAFRELFEGDQAVAPQAVIVNLSVGDPSTPFDFLMSPWARMLDWLSNEYGVLVVVSAGNHPHLGVSPQDSLTISALAGAERRHAFSDAQLTNIATRGMLSPAEAINAVTVGASHEDAAGKLPAGYLVDPHDELIGTSPSSALGPGYRRSVKPDLAAPGGRVVYSTPFAAESALRFRGSMATGPGIRVADPRRASESHTAGTSAAAALVTRHAAMLQDDLDRLQFGSPLSRRQRALLTKALLAHDVSFDDSFDLEHPITRLAGGHGVIRRSFTDGCASNEAVLLYLGSIRPKTVQHLEFPLPNGLSVVGAKRVTASLAWFSPINWRHRQYRQAALSFTAPGGDIPNLGTAVELSADDTKRGATTLQRGAWETNGSFAGGVGSAMSLSVKYFAQAGLQTDEEIEYAVALSLRVDPALQVDIHSQIRDQLSIQVRPRPSD